MTTPPVNCCEKCRDFTRSEGAELRDFFCSNPSCSCHSPLPWRERLLEGLKNAWAKKENNEYPVEGGYAWLESFISSLESEAIERTLNEVIEMIENIKPPNLPEKAMKDTILAHIISHLRAKQKGSPSQSE